MSQLAGLRTGLQTALRFWPLALIALIGLVLWAEQAGFGRHDAALQEIKVDCASLDSGCSVQADGRTLRFGMQANAKPLAPFDIWVSATGSGATSEGAQAIGKVEARFTMEGMDMGFNLYTLRPDAQGVFRARVTLPICVTGRRDWTMILEVDQTRLLIPFVTNL